MFIFFIWENIIFTNRCVIVSKILVSKIDEFTLSLVKNINKKYFARMRPARGPYREKIKCVYILSLIFPSCSKVDNHFRPFDYNPLFWTAKTTAMGVGVLCIIMYYFIILLLPYKNYTMSGCPHVVATEFVSFNAMRLIVIAANTIKKKRERENHDNHALQKAII